MSWETSRSPHGAIILPAATVGHHGEELSFRFRESRGADSLAIRSRRVRFVTGAAVCAVAFGDTRKN
jgi:hypothetical protein